MLASPYFLLLIPALACVLTFVYVMKIIATPPKGRAKDVLQKPQSHQRKVVACIGDSLTHGNIGVCWVEHLRRQLPNHLFINEGINGDVAWQLLQRLPSILECQPDIVFVLIGSNDAMGSFNSSSGERYQKSNKLPHQPSFELYKEHLGLLLDGLARVPQVFVCTLPPVGELPDSPMNQHLVQFNQFIHEITSDKNRILIDVSAAMWQQLNQRTYPVIHDYDSNMTVLGPRILKACLRHYLFKTPWDTIAESRGQWLLFDQIHLGERGAQVIENLVLNHLEKTSDKAL